jgi:hypothetical protein
MNVPPVIPGAASYLGMDVPSVIPVEDIPPWDGCPTSHPSLGFDVPPFIPA